MNKLIEQLLEFQDSRRNKGVGLEKLFEKLAKYLLYGGHFHCSERYDLYITSVEFYYHEEIGDNYKRIVDPIMYHRNVKDKPVVPYLNVGTLYPHWSGVDITFEDEKLQYRASALIRSYRIVQLKPERLELKESDLSTYVYDYLFDGLSVDKKETAINWIDDKVILSNCKVNAYKRKNVNLFKYNYEKTEDEPSSKHDNEFIKIKNKQDSRRWRFVREGSDFDIKYVFKGK
jgi:hypothetical protein